jgi:hypothetical protein
MSVFDIPRRKSGRGRHLTPVPHQPAAAGFSDPAPVQFQDRRLARIEQDMATVAVDLAWLRRTLERFAGDEGNGAGCDAAGWAEEPGTPAWHADPDATLTGMCSAADVTMPDQRAQMARPYAPEPEPETFEVPPVEADLDALPLFRDAVRTEIVRRGQHARGNRGGGSWRDRYASLYAGIWDAPPLPDFRIAEMMAARFGTGAP